MAVFSRGRSGLGDWEHAALIPRLRWWRHVWEVCSDTSHTLCALWTFLSRAVKTKSFTAIMDTFYFLAIELHAFIFALTILSQQEGAARDDDSLFHCNAAFLPFHVSLFPQATCMAEDLCGVQDSSLQTHGDEAHWRTVLGLARISGWIPNVVRKICWLVSDQLCPVCSFFFGLWIYERVYSGECLTTADCFWW